MRGGLPNKVDIFKLITFCFRRRSVTINSCSAVAVPTNENGHLSLAQIFWKCSACVGLTAKTYLSCDSLHQISIGDIDVSATRTSRISNVAPRSESWTSSGRAFERPPAPTSWIDWTGFSSPKSVQASITC